jgi:hypothetical protein
MDCDCLLDCYVDLKIDVNSSKFYEFYGILLGDGWLSHFHSKKSGKPFYWVGISGHMKDDLLYLYYVRDLIFSLFSKKVIFKFKNKENAVDIVFCSKQIISFLNHSFNFPVGKKLDLKIHEIFIKNNLAMLYIIKGLMDTDGSIYLSEANGYSYPYIELHMNAPNLLDQVNDHFLKNGFKPQRRANRVILKSWKQVDKYVLLYGFNNSKHFLRYEKFKELRPK